MRCFALDAQGSAVNLQQEHLSSKQLQFRHYAHFPKQHRPVRSCSGGRRVLHIRSESVQPSNTPYGRGLVSREHLPAGRRLLSVPFSQLLLLPEWREGQSEEELARFTFNLCSLPLELFRFITGKARWDLRLTAWLLFLRKRGSKFWKQYMETLPKESEMACLLNYAPEEQSELQWLAAEAAVQYNWAQESHESMFSSHTGHLKSLQLADTLQDSLWAMSMVRSRTFSDQAYGTEITLMVPTADLANHAFQHNATYALSISQGIFELKSCRRINVGDAICISYGEDKANDELMRDYGFFVPGNPNDRLDFASSSWQQQSGVIAKPATLLFKALNSSPAPLPETERPKLMAGPLLKALKLQGKLQAGKDALKDLAPEGMTTRQAAAAHASDADLARRLNAVLSLPVCASANEAAGQKTSSFWPPKSATESGQPALRTDLSSTERAQQRQAADMLQQHCRSLQAWGTSLQHDKSLLQDAAGLSHRHRQAIAARIEHKLLIEVAHDTLQKYKDSVGDAVILGGLFQR